MQALFSDAAATASYVDALAIVEFVSTFGQLWEALPISLPELQQAVENPVDHPALGQLYNTLLSCVLLDQVRCLLSTTHRSPKRVKTCHVDSKALVRRHLSGVLAPVLVRSGAHPEACCCCCCCCFALLVGNCWQHSTTTCQLSALTGLLLAPRQ